jgi:hypothetical protein
LSKVLESQEIPTVPHLGALRVASYTAVWAVALLFTVTVTVVLVPTFPAASKALEKMVWLLPLVRPVVFHE